MGLILRTIERMLQMLFSMARKFMLQLLRRYDEKFSEQNRTKSKFRLRSLLAECEVKQVLKIM